MLFRSWVSGYAQDVENPLTGELFKNEDEVLDYFRSLYEDASPNEKLPLRFYINGIGEDLTSAIHDVQRSMFNVQRSTSSVHDLQGRRVTAPKKGLYIINGKKVFIK